MGTDGLEVPQLGEFERPWAMAVGFLDFQDESLQMFGIVIRVIQLQIDVPAG
jgi:hypothetical protein